MLEKARKFGNRYYSTQPLVTKALSLKRHYCVTNQLR